MTVFPNIFAGPKGEGAEDMIVVGGGVMPAEEVDALKKNGR
jgi:methylmalonyl-CoA mutase cobalamin-binding subunit